MKRAWFLAILWGGLVFAQDSAVTAPGEIDPSLRAEVRKLLQTMHLEDIMHQQLKNSLTPIIRMMKQNPAVSAQMADEFSKEFEAAIFSSHELTDMVADAYANHFTLSEIKDLEAFYSSPTGRKMVDAQPELMTEVSKRAGSYGQGLALELIGKIGKEHPEYLKKDASQTSGGVMGGVPGAPPPPPPPPPKPFKAPTLPDGMSWVHVAAADQQATIITKVPPVYPPLAKSARVQGTVVFEAYIGMDGKVQEVQLVSGHPLLINAAMSAVKQWVYKPLLVDGKPVPVLTTVVVNFTLSE